MSNGQGSNALTTQAHQITQVPVKHQGGSTEQSVVISLDSFAALHPTLG
jgi:hypothetical protein